MKSCGVETTSVTSEYPGCSDPAGGMLLLCAGCDGPILDRFLLNVLDRVWHAKCVQCSECRCALADKCFARDGRLFCRQDFFRRFGTKCGGCGQGISPHDLVRRARQSVYHLKCFTCSVCRKQLSTGEQLYVVDDTQIICRDDFIASKLHLSTGYADITDADVDSSRLQDKLQNHGLSEERDVISPSTTAPGLHCSFSDGSPSHRSPAFPSLPPPGNHLCVRDGCTSPSSVGDWAHGGGAAALKLEVVTPPLCGGGPPHGGTGNDVIGGSGDRLPPCTADDCMSMDSMSSCGDDTSGSGRTALTNNNNVGEHRTSKDKGDEGGTLEQPTSAGGGTGSAGAKRRGPRTTIKAKQLETLKSAFAATPKPTRHIREQLAQETGLNMRVIQVWFQNRRSKERRMKQLSAMGARRQFFRNPRRLRALRPGEDFPVDGVDLLASGALGYFTDNCDFYPTYAGFDYFAGVHRHASDFLTPPPPPGVAVSAGPHHVGPPPQPQQQQPLADHVTPPGLHDGLFMSAGDLVLPASQPAQQQQPAQHQLTTGMSCSSPDDADSDSAALLDAATRHHFTVGGLPCVSAQSTSMTGQTQAQAPAPQSAVFTPHSNADLPPPQITEAW